MNLISLYVRIPLKNATVPTVPRNFLRPHLSRLRFLGQLAVFGIFFCNIKEQSVPNASDSSGTVGTLAHLPHIGHDGCMSDDASKRDENAPVIGRPFVPGNPGGPGRPRLPDWFKSRGPAALRVLVAQATGEAIPEDDGRVSAAVTEAATLSSPKVRAAASIEIVNRIYGKAPDVIAGDPDSPLAVSVIRRVIVDPAGKG